MGHPLGGLRLKEGLPGIPVTQPCSQKGQSPGRKDGFFLHTAVVDDVLISRIKRDDIVRDAPEQDLVTARGEGDQDTVRGPSRRVDGNGLRMSVDAEREAHEGVLLLTVYPEQVYDQGKMGGRKGVSDIPVIPEPLYTDACMDGVGNVKKTDVGRVRLLVSVRPVFQGCADRFACQWGQFGDRVSLLRPGRVRWMGAGGRRRKELFREGDDSPLESIACLKDRTFLFPLVRDVRLPYGGETVHAVIGIHMGQAVGLGDHGGPEVRIMDVIPGQRVLRE